MKATEQYFHVVLFIMPYKNVNALSEWIIGIYLHEFTNNEREISISSADKSR